MVGPVSPSSYTPTTPLQSTSPTARRNPASTPHHSPNPWHSQEAKATPPNTPTGLRSWNSRSTTLRESPLDGDHAPGGTAFPLLKGDRSPNDADQSPPSPSSPLENEINTPTSSLDTPILTPQHSHPGSPRLAPGEPDPSPSTGQNGRTASETAPQDQPNARQKLEIKTPANDPNMFAQRNLKEDFEELTDEFEKMQTNSSNYAKNPEQGEASSRKIIDLLENLTDKVGKNSEIGKALGRMKDKMNDQLDMFSKRASQNMEFDWIKSFIETLQQCAKDCAAASTKR